MHPLSNRERDSHAGTRPKQRYDRWDGPRGRQRSPGRHWDKSWDQARPQEGTGRDRRTQESNAHGNPMETPTESDRLTLRRPAQGIDEGIHQGSKVNKLQLSPYKNEKHHRTSTHRR